MPADPHLRGNPGRRPRLSDAETEERMLTAGVEFVRQHGLSLSLEHLSMEDLIKEAGVSRTSSYRRWPTKDQFAADLLLRLARAPITSDLGYLVSAIEEIPDEAFAHLDTEQGRLDALVEVERATMVADFAATVGSPRWQAYIVLRAAHIGLPEGEVRTQIAAALRDTERTFTQRRARVFATVAALLGRRLRDPDAVGWDALADAVSATVTGMVVRAWSDPDAATATRPLAPFGTSRVAEWNTAGLAAASLFLDATEPDPAVTWDDARVARLRAALADVAGTLDALWAGATAQSAS